MNCDLERVILEFLNHHYDPSRPLLLGLSGGPDSLALLYLLLKFKERYPLELGLAHIDHRWREESESEALHLQALAQHLNLPFHLKTLNPCLLNGNLEAISRQERLAFFLQLCKEHNYQAVILGHHAGDQAETVLKRLFEGASLPCLTGLHKTTTVQEVTIWRPLLTIPKQIIVSWLQQHNYIPFDDRTNLDPSFMRGRMRTSIIPQLSNTFGKEISKSLCRIGAEAQELQDHLDECIKPYMSHLVKSSVGIFLDLTEGYPKSSFELKYLIRKLCEIENFFLSRELVDLTSDFIKSGVSNRQVLMGNRTLYIDRRRLFIRRREFSELPDELIPLETGNFQYGSWQITVMPTYAMGIEESNWKSAWEGRMEIVLPVGSYFIGQARISESYPGKLSSLSKWWTNHKVPAFLRKTIPVIWQNGTIRHEFLTGKAIQSQNPTKDWIKIVLTMVG